METLTSFLGGEAGLILALVSIVFIIINIRAIINQNKNSIKSERNERFKNAIEQLGNDKNAMVLGGIYTLHRIAKEDKNYRENIFNILCSFVRDITTTESYQQKYTNAPSEPIQTILNILCLNKNDSQIYCSHKNKLKINFYNAYLYNANLEGVNLTDADLRLVNISSARLMNANLTNADLRSAHFIFTDLTASNLMNANLANAHFGSTNLANANLTNANLINADLTNVNLTNTYLSGAIFINANLMKINLTNADLMNANFTCAYLNGTIFTGANLMNADLNGTIFINANLMNTNFICAYLNGTIFTGANLMNARLINTCSLKDSYDCFMPFEDYIRSNIGKKTDLSGIKDGYDSKNPQFTGEPIFGSYNREEAEEIIKKYKNTFINKY